MENELREILQAGLAAADPKDAVLRSVRLEGHAVLTEDARFEPERIFVVAAGKAAGAMAQAAPGSVGGRARAGIAGTAARRGAGERVWGVGAGGAGGAMARAAQELFGDRIEAGIVVTKDGHDEGPEGFETVFASHPEPGERGVEASRKVRELAAFLGEGDLLLALIAGGASALLADPAPPIEIGDLTKLTQDLPRGGAAGGGVTA